MSFWVFPDRDRPQVLAVVRAVGEDLSHLAGDRDNLGLNPVDRSRRDDRGNHLVVVAGVMGDGLTEPEEFSGLAVQGDE